MTKTTHAYLPVGILASQRVRGRVPPRFNTVLERETYYSTVSKERDVQEREERETYRDRRQAGTLAKREDRERRSARDRTCSLAFVLEVPYQLHHKNLVEAAVLVHVHALGSARACSKLTQACPVHPKMPKEASLYKT